MILSTGQKKLQTKSSIRVLVTQIKEIGLEEVLENTQKKT
jgi:hypothetical protein